VGTKNISGTGIKEVRGMGIDISVIIPTYNEEENVEKLYDELIRVLHSLKRAYEIIFVDDRSTDKTYSRLLELHKRDPLVKIIRLRTNFGQSAAMKAGFDHAKGERIITMDADLQNDPNDIPALLAKMEEDDLDVVCGWRYNRQDPMMKRFFSKISNRLRTFLTQETIHDSGCTLRAYKKECINDIELYGELHRYIPAILFWKGYRVGEVRTNHRDRLYGQSKYNWKRIFKGFLDLLVITFWQKYSTRPMHIFGGVGIILGLIGFIISLYLVIERLFFGMSLSDRPLFIVGIMLVVIGVQFFAFGILADIMMKLYHDGTGRKNYLVEQIIG
jgi:glycosyltransferase involved in cell wall biosynthesis